LPLWDGFHIIKNLLIMQGRAQIASATPSTSKSTRDHSLEDLNRDVFTA